MSPALRHRVLWQIIGAALVALVVGLTLSPTPPADLTAMIDWGDKAGHAAAYLVLMGWYAQLYHPPGARLAVAGALMALGFGLELIQGQIAGRSFELADAAANGAGVLLAWWLTRGRLANLLAGLEARL
ncbi:MAG: hypothetical protein GWO16_11840 [Gammaproteobacteria bacterium]|nr:hypothetical protein [Gammaproteobacteria bacterium]NIR98619.1 hypothetical protein [Gammaproteobacteria bacterium]NIT64342.1 hypothetical protein [Gammaproteobacteria bacterium]NIV21266.1 hypothetical protein [Gammaproteobacteria bacterium]NIX10970.1 hypothetical protein [Gammaproteobacteria bacterium]